MTEIEHVTSKKTTIKMMLKYQDLPIGNHPWNEFGVKIWGYMNCFGFIVWQQVQKGYYKVFF